jgi:hypothetical protein
MMSKRTENVTRVDVRIPNELYEEIVAIAIHHFNAKIHHRSNKPEVTPTILELIKIGIAHIESTLPVTKDVTNEKVTDELRQQIELLNLRLRTVENKLSSVNVTAPIAESDTTGDEKILSDMELSELLGVSNLLISDYRVKGKKPRGQALAKALTEQWEVKGEGWVRKSS